ncbi:hypothetical protein CSB45_07465 [candidate division KSB3 bacterium]|uniref:Probable membrane transporter protein n=1 Tax=candidate division KSB3 bacterium TaxID=2044937 RepID=A0A2G6E5K9_9BACT|nr:MAG: hypothetical protein CSB45_07465 [candidate division KSB3 bacterium]PIE29873.1 MAG: hypothetical protein CSA57_06170 [candidate division KSB3 bacterium]
MLFAEAFLLSAGIGILTGVFGVGGGFLMTPAMMIILGLPGSVAVGTSLATMLCTSSFGLFTRRGSNTIDVKIVAFMAVGSLIGVWTGSTQLERLKKLPALRIHGHEVVAVQYVLLWVFMGILLWTAGFMVYDYRRKRQRGDTGPQVGLLAGIAFPPYAHFSSLVQPRLAVVPLILLGLFVGILTGLMGIGGGVVLLPVLIYLIGQPTAKAAGTSLLLVWISAMMGVYINARLGNIQLMLLAAMVAGGVIGTSAGTHIGLKADESKLRLYFVYVILAAAVMIGMKLAHMTL